MNNILHDFARVNGVRLHYASAGNGERLVLLLHGFPEFWYSWRHQIEALSDTYTVVAPDLRGYNLSDKPPEVIDYEIDKLVGDVTGLIEHFGRDQAAVIGHDWGASIAWALAMKNPGVLWKLGALQVPPIPVWKRNQTAAQFFASWYMFFFQLPHLPEYIFEKDDYAKMVRSLRETASVENVFSNEDIAKYKNAWGQPGAPTAMLNYYRANIMKRLLGPKSMPSKIKVPTLFIYGEKDKAILPQTVAGVADMIDGPYTEHRISNAGHWVQQEARDEVTRVIRNFLDTT